MVVNMDPGNDRIPYPCSIDVKNLISWEMVMEERKIGPNAALLYCMEYIEQHIDWLFEQMDAFPEFYFILDCPGQVEITTDHPSLRNILKKLEKRKFNMVSIHLVDSLYCSEPYKYISAVLLCLKVMAFLEFPHLNVLSKIDILPQLHFNLSYYTEVMDLDYILDHLNNDFSTKKYQRLNKAICEMISDFSLVSFQTLAIEDKDSVTKLLGEIDKANGFVFGADVIGNESIFQTANSSMNNNQYFIYLIAGIFLKWRKNTQIMNKIVNNWRQGAWILIPNPWLKGTFAI